MPVLIDVRTVSREATLKDLESIRRPEDLPPGARLAADMERTLRLQAPIRWCWQMHWVREAVAGALAGLSGIRADAAAEAQVDVAWDGVFRAEVTREEERLHLRLFRGRSASLGASVKLAAGSPNTVDELLQAITGLHPLGWVQSFMRDMGSNHWRDLADAAGVPTRLLEDLTSRWLRMGPREQAALFHASGEASRLQTIFEWCERITGEIEGPAALHQAVADWPWHDGEANRALLDWLEAAAGAVLDGPVSPVSFDRLKRAAWEVHSMLAQDGLAGALQLLRGKAAALAGPGLAGLSGLAQALGGRAEAALSKTFSAQLALRASAATAETALVDALFEFTPAGLAAYRRTISGDLQAALVWGTRGVEVKHAVLSHHLRRRFELELHLPFMDVRSWERVTEAMAQTEITTDETGRTLVLSMKAQNTEEARNRYQSLLSVTGGFLVREMEEPQASFRLAFEDRRSVKPGDTAEPWYQVLAAYGLAQQAREWVAAAGAPVEAALTVRAPGELVAGWIGLPSERELAFFFEFRRASLAVQRALRNWLPACWFADLDRYDDLDAAFPLLVYQATDAYPGRPKTQFNYDVLDSLSMDRAWRSANRRLPRILADVQGRLLAAGRKKTAAFYDPELARKILSRIQRQPRMLHALLMGDAAMVNQMADLAAAGRDIRALIHSDPVKATRETAKFGERFTKAFRRRLRRLYAGEGFEALGSILLVEATAALHGGDQKRVEAVLRLRCGSREQVLA
jgi:hypothetical protein